MYAKTIYVDANLGNDATSYDNNNSLSPWATIGRAAWGSVSRTSPNASQAAQAGDTVIVRAGTYTTTGTNSRYTPAYNPINSGTASSPITFQSEGTVIFTYSSGTGPVIGSLERNYITWRGFSVDEALTPAASDTGPVVLWGCFGCIIEYCDLDGNAPFTFGAGELHNGVRINGGGDNIVRHNYIHDFGTGGSNSNVSGILVDHSAGGIIENNEIANSDGVFFIKRNYNSPGRWIIRRNFGRDSGNGIRADQLVLTTGNPTHTVDIYQNLLVNIRESAFFTHHYESRESYYIRIVNNTVKNCGRAFEGSTLTTNANHVFQNNIITNCPLGYRSQDYPEAWTPSTFISRHNLFRGLINAATFRFEFSGQTTLTFTSWMALGQDAALPPTQLTDPLFINEAQGNFRLQESSPSRNAGIDFFDLNQNGSTSDPINLGAYITGNEIIGRSPYNTTPTPRLSAPRAVRVN